MPVALKVDDQTSFARFGPKSLIVMLVRQSLDVALTAAEVLRELTGKN
jgi:hypothetical protein